MEQTNRDKHILIRKQLLLLTSTRQYLGRLLFSVYCAGLSDVFSKHGIRYHVYAGDKQLYVDFLCARPPPTGYPAESLT